MVREGVLVGGSKSSDPSPPYAATWTDLQLAAVPLSLDQELRKDVSESKAAMGVMMLLAAIDTPLTFLLDTINLPWDIKTWLSSRRQDNSEGE